MNTAHPASLPPGPRSSGGIRRSTAASISAASSAVKNIQGPGRTGKGGEAAPASQGIPPEMVRERAPVPATSRAAVEASNERREMLEGERLAIVLVSRTPARTLAHRARFG